MGQPPQLITALLNPSAYPHRVGTIELIETHISWVLLTGRFAYKIKKPVDLEFVDFSTLEKRRQACELELTLNRRLAADLYLETVPITADGPRIAGSGETIEYAVKMRQFDPGHTLDHLIESVQRWIGRSTERRSTFFGAENVVRIFGGFHWTTARQVE